MPPLRWPRHVRSRVDADARADDERRRFRDEFDFPLIMTGQAAISSLYFADDREAAERENAWSAAPMMILAPAASDEPLSARVPELSHDTVIHYASALYRFFAFAAAAHAAELTPAF